MKKQFFVMEVLIAFLAFTGYVVYQHGLGFIDLAFANSVTTLLATDLVIALSLATIWMWKDARSQGMNPLPYTVLTLMTGSAGPLLYIFMRMRNQKVVSQQKPVGMVA